MITLTAKINLLSGDNTALSLGSNNLSGNNISGDLELIRGKKQVGSNPFIIGASKLGDGSTFSGKVDYFIGDVISNENGNFTTPYGISINSGKALNSITIAFDKLNNRHPQKVGISVSKVFSVICINQYSNNIYGGTITLRKEDIPNNYILTNIYYSTANENLPVPTIKENTSGYFSITAYGSSLFYVQEVVVVFSLANGVKDDDSIFTICGLNNARAVDLNIDNWNAPKYPLVITGIYVKVSIDIDRRNLIGISRSIFDRGDLKLPNFGILSNTGEIEFNDLDGEIRDYAEQLLLQSGLKCEINLNNTLVDGASQTIGVFETDQWDYDNDNRVVSVSLKDDLEEWQEINVEGILYDAESTVHQNLTYYYKYLYSKTPSKYNMCSFEKLDIITKGILSNTWVKYPLLKNGSLWQQWTKLCEVCQLHIYKNNDGEVVCRYNGGN